MKLSTRGRYSARALLDLALHCGKGPVLLADIAKRQQISGRYLGQLMAPLMAAGLVKSARGARGGFTLARPPSEIRLSEIVQASEGSMAPVECVDDFSACPRASLCVTREVWAEMKRAMNEVLESTTLQELMERQRGKGETEGIMYSI